MSEGRAVPTTETVLLRRLRAGSKPHGRDDDFRVALVIEGGGMRGTVSAGMMLALEQLGLRDCFDLAVGTSAGAIGAAFFVAGRSTEGSVLYYSDLNSPPFLDRRRLLRLQSALDLHYLVDQALPMRGLDPAAVSGAPIPVFATVTPVLETNETHLMRVEGDDARVASILKATASLPVLAGSAKVVDGESYVDGGLLEQVPWRSAVGLGATHLLVLPSRPVQASEDDSLSLIERVAMLRMVRARHGDRVADLVESLPLRASIEMTSLRAVADGLALPLAKGSLPAASVEPGWEGHIRIVELDSNVPLPARLETSRSVLVDAMMAGVQALLNQFGLDGMNVEQRVVINHPVARVSQFRSSVLAEIVSEKRGLNPNRLTSDA